MRRVLLSLVAALLTTFSLPSLAQQANMSGPAGPGPKVNPTLEGIWQLCKFQKSDSGQFELHVLPVIKIISKDGAYHDMVLRGEGGGCGIAEEGTFKKENDTTLILTPQADPQAQEQAVSEKKVVFHLQGPQWMVIERNASEPGKKKHDIWMRLRMIRDGQNLIESFLKGDMGTSEGQGQMRGPGGDNKGKAGGQRQRPNGNRQTQGNSNSSQNQTTSPIDNTWMNDN
jgi:hypothetical protein